MDQAAAICLDGIDHLKRDMPWALRTRPLSSIAQNLAGMMPKRPENALKRLPGALAFSIRGARLPKR